VRSRVIFVALALALGSVASAGDDSKTPASEDVSPADKAEALVEQLRRGDPEARDEAVKALIELAAAEDERQATDRPVHAVLDRATADPDADVRFRIRRVVADPEIRVERLMVSLLDPMQTERVKETRQKILDRGDRPVARAGLVRIALRAAQAGFDPLTKKANEVWHPWGLEGGARLRETQRFHLALDLLGEMTSDGEVAPVCELLQEDLGDSLADVIDAIAARPTAARICLRQHLRDERAVARENAALALGEIGTAEDAPFLEGLLQDSEPRVRRAAITAFEMLPLDAAACVKAAGHANDASPMVQTAALHLAGTRGHRFVLEAARKVVSTPDAPFETRVAAVRALGRAGDASGTLRTLASGFADTGKYAAWAIGAASDQEGLGTLETLLGRDDAVGETGIYFAIARAGAVSWLDRLSRSTSDVTRRLAISALGAARGDPEEIANLLEQAASRAVEHTRGSDWNDFLAAFRALRDRDDPASRKSMGVLLDQAVLNAQRGTGVDDATLYLLVEYCEEARATSTVRALSQISRNNRRPRVRDKAMDALATIDPRRAKEVLAPLVDSGQLNGEVMEAAARSLVRAGESRYAEKSVDLARRKLSMNVNGNLDRYVDALNQEGIEHAYAAQVEDAVLCFRRIRWLKPDNDIGSYNIACCLALAGDKDAAMRWLRRSVREGFKDWRHISRDPDLQCLYEEPRFTRLIDDLRQEQEVDPAVER